MNRRSLKKSEPLTTLVKKKEKKVCGRRSTLIPSNNKKKEIFSRVSVASNSKVSSLKEDNRFSGAADFESVRSDPPLDFKSGYALWWECFFSSLYRFLWSPVLCFDFVLDCIFTISGRDFVIAPFGVRWPFLIGWDIVLFALILNGGFFCSSPLVF